MSRKKCTHPTGEHQWDGQFCTVCDAVRCGANRKRCKDCKKAPDGVFRFVGEHKDLKECPYCGKDRICCNHPCAGRERCKYHGGMTVVGTSHYRYKDGKTSAFSHLPVDVLKRIEIVCSDPSMYTVENEIKLMLARNHELEERLNNGEYIGLWKRLNKQSKELRAVLDAMQSTNDPDVLSTLAQQRDSLVPLLLEVIENGSQRDIVWKDLRENQEHTAKLKKTLSEMRKEQQAYIPVEEVGRMIHVLGETIGKHIADREVLAVIGTEIQKLMMHKTIEAVSYRHADARADK